ncbi:MAG: prenyltransferase/squalene oxidase repeat-containing protein [Candidatus Bathyarchaeia archaeon]
MYIEHAVVTEKVVKGSIDWAFDWAFTIRNKDFGWGGHPHARTFLTDHCEIMYGMLKAGLNPRSDEVKKSLAYVHDKLINKSWPEPVETSRMHFWALSTLLEAGEPMDSSSIQESLKAVEKFKIKEKGWAREVGKASDIYDTYLAIVALKRFKRFEEELNEAKDWLIETQNEDGGWGFIEASLSDYTPTAIGALALIELGERDSKNVKKALEWLISTQLDTGRWRLSYETPIFWNENIYIHFSTPWAIAALLEGGVRIDSEPIQKGMKYLLNMQDLTGGWPFIGDKEGLHFLWSQKMVLCTWATGHALIALASYVKNLKEKAFV